MDANISQNNNASLEHTPLTECDLDFFPCLDFSKDPFANFGQDTNMQYSNETDNWMNSLVSSEDNSGGKEEVKKEYSLSNEIAKENVELKQISNELKRQKIALESDMAEKEAKLSKYMMENSSIKNELEILNKKYEKSEEENSTIKFRLLDLESRIIQYEALKLKCDSDSLTIAKLETELVVSARAQKKMKNCSIIYRSEIATKDQLLKKMEKHIKRVWEVILDLGGHLAKAGLLTEKQKSGALKIYDNEFKAFNFSSVLGETDMGKALSSLSTVLHEKNISDNRTKTYDSISSHTKSEKEYEILSSPLSPCDVVSSTNTILTKIIPLETCDNSQVKNESFTQTSCEKLPGSESSNSGSKICQLDGKKSFADMPLSLKQEFFSDKINYSAPKEIVNLPCNNTQLKIPKSETGEQCSGSLQDDAGIAHNFAQNPNLLESVSKIPVCEPSVPQVLASMPLVLNQEFFSNVANDSFEKEKSSTPKDTLDLNELGVGMECKESLQEDMAINVSNFEQNTDTCDDKGNRSATALELGFDVLNSTRKDLSNGNSKPMDKCPVLKHALNEDLESSKISDKSKTQLTFINKDFGKLNDPIEVNTFQEQQADYYSSDASMDFSFDDLDCLKELVCVDKKCFIPISPLAPSPPKLEEKKTKTSLSLSPIKSEIILEVNSQLSHAKQKSFKKVDFSPSYSDDSQMSLFKHESSHNLKHESSHNLNPHLHSPISSKNQPKSKKSATLDMTRSYFSSKMALMPIKAAIAIESDCKEMNDKEKFLTKLDSPTPSPDDSQILLGNKESLSNLNQHLNSSTSSDNQTKSQSSNVHDVAKYESPSKVPEDCKQENKVCKVSAKRCQDGSIKLDFNVLKPIILKFDPDTLGIECAIGPFEEPASTVSGVPNLFSKGVSVSDPNSLEPHNDLSPVCKKQKVQEIQCSKVCQDHLENSFASINPSQTNHPNKTYDSDVKHLDMPACPEKQNKFLDSNCKLSQDKTECDVIENHKKIRKRRKKSRKAIVFPTSNIIKHSHVDKSTEEAIPPKQKHSIPKASSPTYEPNLQKKTPAKKPCVSYMKRRLDISNCGEFHRFGEGKVELNQHRLNNEVTASNKPCFKLDSLTECNFVNNPVGGQTSKSEAMQKIIPECYVLLEKLKMPVTASSRGTDKSDLKLDLSGHKSAGAEIKSYSKHLSQRECSVSIKQIRMPRGNQAAENILPITDINVVDCKKETSCRPMIDATVKTFESPNQSLKLQFLEEVKNLCNNLNQGKSSQKDQRIVEKEKISDFNWGGSSDSEHELVIDEDFGDGEQVPISSDALKIKDFAEIKKNNELVKSIETSPLKCQIPPTKPVSLEYSLSKNDQKSKVICNDGVNKESSQSLLRNNSKNKTNLFCNDRVSEKSPANSKFENKSETPYDVFKVLSIDSNSSGSCKKSKCVSNSLDKHLIISKLQNSECNNKYRKNHQEKIGANGRAEYKKNTKSKSIKEAYPESKQVDVQKKPSPKDKKPQRRTKYQHIRKLQKAAEPMTIQERLDLQKETLIYSVLKDIKEESLAFNKFHRIVHTLVNTLINPEVSHSSAELLFHVLKYLCLSRKNPLAVYPTAKNYFPLEEKCIVTALFKIEHMKKPYLQGMLKNAVTTIYELVLSKRGYSIYGLGSLCRVLTEICRQKKDSSGPIDLCCDLLKMKHSFAPFLVASIGGVWKELFLIEDNFSDEEKVLHSAIKCAALKRTKKMSNCTWPTTSKLIDDCFTAPSVPDEQRAMEFLMNRFQTKYISTDASFESEVKLSTALVIFAAHQNSDWIKEHILEKYIIPNLQPTPRRKEKAFHFYCDLYVDIILLRSNNTDKVILKMFEKEITTGDNFFVQNCAAVALIKLLLKWRRPLPDFLKKWMEQHEHDPRLQSAEVFFRRRMMSDRNELSKDDIL